MVGTVVGSEAEARRSIYGDERSLSDSMVNAMREAVLF
jgi:hypothetical protein